MGLETITSAPSRRTTTARKRQHRLDGNLDAYAFADVTVGEASFSATPNLTLEITSQTATTPTTALHAVALSPETTTYVQVRITTDNWPAETGWEIADDNGAVIESVAVGSLTEPADTEFTRDDGLAKHGCYTFTLYDAYGDGLYANLQTGQLPDGTAGVYGMDETQVDIVFEYDGANNPVL